MKCLSMGLLAVTFSLMSMVVRADEGAISHADLVAAIKDKKVALIDCNGTDTYKSGHIPGAIDFAVDGNDLSKKLPSDKSALIVSYCGNEKCNAHKSGAVAATKLGYTNVKHYSGGIAGWKSSGGEIEASK